MTREVKVYELKEDLIRNAAEKIVSIAQKSIQNRGQFAWSLSGGSTPKEVYSMLAALPLKEKIDWEKTHIFWGDERSVVRTHPDSNFRMAKESLLDAVEIPPANIHRVASEEDPMLAAQQYEDDIREFFGISDGIFPEFDLILLGMGDDGHTASLFPDTEALKVQDRLVVDNFVKKLNTHRITFTFPIINHARNVLFIISGSVKSKMIKQVLANTDAPKTLPSQLVQPKSGSLFWFLDKDAAADLT
ncbi:6-phosphogluconolactonase [bacterium]|nr:6-phosphogluconolactonase [bacterium]